MFQSYDLLRYNVDATDCTVVFFINLATICSIVKNFWDAYKPKDLEQVPDASDFSKDGDYNAMEKANSDVRKKNYEIEDENQQLMNTCIDNAIEEVGFSSDVTPAERQRLINLMRVAPIEKWQESLNNLNSIKSHHEKDIDSGDDESVYDDIEKQEKLIRKMAKKCHKYNLGFRNLNSACNRFNIMLKNAFPIINADRLIMQDDEISMGYNSEDQESEKQAWQNDNHDTVFEHNEEKKDKLENEPTEEGPIPQELEQQLAAEPAPEKKRREQLAAPAPEPEKKNRRITPKVTPPDQLDTKKQEAKHTAAFRKKVVDELLAKIQEYKNDADGKEKFTQYYKEMQYGGLDHATVKYEDWADAENAILKSILQTHVRDWINVPPFNPV